MADPRVSVVIPTRNRREFVAQAVADALAQEDVAVEVVVVDDGSTEDDALRGVDEQDPRVRVIRHARRHGVARARNTGIGAARGRWVAFMDDDDRWAPDKLRTQLEAATEQDTAWVYSGAITIDDADRMLYSQQPTIPADFSGWVLVNPVPGGCSNVMARTELVREVGAFDEQLSLLADWDLWIRLAGREQPATSEQLVTGYRLHPDNMHARNVDSLDGELAYVTRKYEAYSCGRSLDPQLLLWRAYAHRRAGLRRRAAGLYLKRWRLRHEPRDLARTATALIGEHMVGHIQAHRARSRQARPEWLDQRTA